MRLLPMRLLPMRRLGFGDTANPLVSSPVQKSAIRTVDT